MPTYTYVCQTCSQPFEIRRSMAEYATAGSPACPRCGSAEVVRTFTPIPILHAASGAAGTAGCCGSSAGPGCCGG